MWNAPHWVQSQGTVGSCGAHWGVIPHPLIPPFLPSSPCSLMVGAQAHAFFTAGAKFWGSLIQLSESLLFLTLSDCLETRKLQYHVQVAQQQTCSHHNLHIKRESLEVTHPPLDSFNKGWWIVSKWQFRKIKNSPLYCFKLWCTRAVLSSVKVVFACEHYYSPSQWWEMLLPQEYIHAAAYLWLLENLPKPFTGGKWGSAKSWMCCCLWDAALGSLPMWIVGSRRDWALIHPQLPPRQECQEEASPKPTCTGPAPRQHILGLGETWPAATWQSPALFSSSLLFSF